MRTSKIFFGILFVVFLSPLVLMAQDFPKPKLGVNITGGWNNIAGDLGSAREIWQGAGVELYGPRRSEKYFGYLAFDFHHGSTTNHGTGLILSPEEGVSLRRNSFSAVVCGRPESALHPCLEVGYVLMQVHQAARSTITYGDFLFGGGLRYEFKPKWNFGFMSEFTHIPVSVNSRESFMDFWVNRFFLSYIWTVDE